ncbi:MAG: hypothetical protein SPG37_06960 [Eubacteriales bacterium]|nr:hypothetical protein [Eubacteriales bacterium]
MKFNLFSLVNDKRQKKKGPNRVLSDLDYALFLSAFSAIFGILHYRMWHETLKVSVGGLVMTLLFCAFWIGMAFSGGRYRRKGFWITALVIWGVALLCCVANLKQFSFLQELSGTVAGTLAGYMAIIFLMFVTATVAPLMPGLAMVGIYAQTEMQLVWLCAGFMAVIAVSYVLGVLYQKRKQAAADAVRAEILRKQ